MKAIEKYCHIQVSGEDISSVISGISASSLSRVLLAKYGLTDVQRGGLYPMASYLRLLHDLEVKMPTVLKNIGKSIIDEALFPPDVKSFEQAMVVADQGYYMNHQGAKPDEIGHYAFEKKTSRHFVMTVDSPYPCLFDEGVILGIARRFQAVISLRHGDDQCRRKGSVRCLYDIDVKG